ncbi:MAG: FHA domain-containing protein [Clostridiales bacterium]|nr:FHA domain-containing protein [Clostridiales bacterium]
MIIGIVMHPAPVFIFAALLLGASIALFYYFIRINRRNKVEFDAKLAAYNKAVEELKRKEEERKKKSPEVPKEANKRIEPAKTISYTRSIQFMAPNGSSFDVPMTDTITIGKSQRCDFIVDDKTLSDVHCKVLYSEGKYIIQDLGSKMGTYFDGVRIPSSTATEIKTGVLQMGKTTFFMTIDEDQG